MLRRVLRGVPLTVGRWVPATRRLVTHHAKPLERRTTAETKGPTCQAYRRRYWESGPNEDALRRMLIASVDIAAL